ncbi:TetR/AcrR family transcriptional regulator [Flavobacterium sp.]|uniref:TetR/AcrR family transcriptional regulator n=1 Tax=Flavobacterium sp. TaxID=239 RepID=UPI003527C68A
MKEKIIEKAAEMFVSHGFKSITMDDIACELGISKKTIYQHFTTKPDLVKSASFFVFEKISSGIDAICQKSTNPIEELFDIKNFVSDYLKTENSTTTFQLQKYYPKIHDAIKKLHLEKMENCIIGNLTRGITANLYRKEIEPSIIGRFYFAGISSCKDETLFPSNIYNNSQIHKEFLIYHLRGIGTPKGLEILEKTIQKQTN